LNDKKRFVFVDGLRGLAALWVLAYHLWHQPVYSALAPVTPAPLVWLGTHGRLGVQVFFVLSGFVIAHSLSDYALGARSTLLFIARRQVRLDPCYWAALALATGNILLSRWLNSNDLALPSAKTYLLHVLYLQHLTGTHNLLTPSWSLCIEVQLYLVFVVLLLATRTRFLATVAVFFLGVASLTVTLKGQTDDLNSIFITHWYMFGLGVLAYWMHQGSIRRGVVAAAAILAIAVFAWTGRLEPLVAALTTTALALASRRGTLKTWLGSRLWQFFGRISYPLYLIHVDVGFRIVTQGFRIAKTPWAALLWVTIAAAACILVADLIHLVVERPSLRAASWLRPARPGDNLALPRGGDAR